jgi:hypothetical protein
VEEEAVVVAAGIAAAPAMKPAATPVLRNILKGMLTRDGRKPRAQQHGKHFLYNLIFIAMTSDLESMTLNIIEAAETSTNAASWSGIVA